MLDTAIHFFTIGASLVAGAITGGILVWLTAAVLVVGLGAVIMIIAALFSK